MEIVKKSVTTEVVEKVVSCDGKFERYVTDNIPLDKAKRDIEEYEKKVSVVLWERMVDRGLLREVKNYPSIDKDKLTPEQKWEKHLYNFADSIVDSGCGNYSYFVFSPKTEDDITDLLTYAKTDSDGEDIWFPGDEWEDTVLSCTRKNLVPGYKYLYCEHCDGYKHIYRLDMFKAKLINFVDGLEDLDFVDSLKDLK